MKPVVSGNIAFPMAPDRREEVASARWGTMQAVVNSEYLFQGILCWLAWGV